MTKTAWVVTEIVYKTPSTQKTAVSRSMEYGSFLSVGRVSKGKSFNIVSVVLSLRIIVSFQENTWCGRGKRAQGRS